MKYRIAILSCTALILAGCGGKPAPLFSLEKTLEGAVVDNQGDAVTTSYVLNTDYLLLYFSAHWCPPCRAFTPKLVDFYQNEVGGQLFQVLFISNDHNDQEMRSYMRDAEMPWPAVVYHSDARKIMTKHYSGQGIPRLVLINKNGRVLADTFSGSKYLGPQHVLEELKKRLAKRKIDPVGISESTGEVLPPTKDIKKEYKVEGIGIQGGRDIAVINGEVVSKGDEIDKGVVVFDITAEYVELSFEGNRYRLLPK
ncbi:MAG: thioredoxin-like domain-containing protein [Verrucomicrobiota bacterium]